MHANERGSGDTIVSAAFVLRVPLEEISAIKSAIEERGGRIVFQRMSISKLYISDEAPEHLRENEDGEGTRGR